MPEPKDEDKKINLRQNPDGSVERVRPEDAPPLEAVDTFQGLLIDSYTYAKIAESVQGEQAEEVALDFIDRYLEEMAPRNPVERMLAVQMLWQHTRIAGLTRIACREKRVDILKAMNAAIDSGMNTYRRQAGAWDQLRAPKQTVQFIKGQQVNVGEQQMVMQQGGCGDAGADAPNPSSFDENANEKRREQAALPPESPGAGVLESICRPRETVGAQHRSDHV